MNYNGNTMKIIFLISICIMLNACTTSRPKTIIKEVKIPIITECPAPPIDAFEKPELSIFLLKKNASPDEVAKAYADSVKKLQQWGIVLQEYLRGYVKK